jgi:hypothetical protein
VGGSEYVAIRTSRKSEQQNFPNFSWQNVTSQVAASSQWAKIPTKPTQSNAMNIWTQTRMGFHSNSDAFYDSMKLLSLADY